MRAVIQTVFGGPEVLAVSDLRLPAPRPDEVLVRVRAAGVNPVDAAVRAGYFKLLGEPPFVLGWDISGTVEALGSEVRGVAVGDQVFGMPYFPKQAAAYAEFVAAPADQLAPKPGAIGHAEAAALPLAGLTAWQALVGTAGLKQGDRVLIHAAAGGVGHLAVQIAKARGAHVVATASGAKLDFVRGLGADEVIDRTGQDFVELVRDVEVVLDPIGGEHIERSLKALRPGGVLLALLDPSDRARAEASERDVRLERISVVPDRDGLLQLAGLIETGMLKVRVARAFPLERASEAHAFLAEQPMGKLVLTVE